MAYISSANLSVTRDKKRKTVKVKVSGKVHFTALELCMMKNCPESKLIKLRCRLMGDDLFFDDTIYVFPSAREYPDNSPSASEAYSFQDTFGESLLDEDTFGRDEVYGKLSLTNNFSGTTSNRNTNVVKDWF